MFACKFCAGNDSTGGIGPSPSRSCVWNTKSSLPSAESVNITVVISSNSSTISGRLSLSSSSLQLVKARDAKIATKK